MTNRLFVGGLDYSVTDAQLSEAFAAFGKVVSAKVIVDRYTGQGKGFGFVEMSSEDEAKLAMGKLDGTQIAGRSIAVKEAKPQENRAPRDDRGAGGGNRW